MVNDDNSEQIDEENIITEGGYARKAGFDKGAVVQSAVQKCIECRAKDIRPGYTTWVPTKDGGAKPTIIPDYRKEYIGAVEGLKAVMSPEILNSNYKEIKVRIDKILEKKQKLFENYAYKEKKYKIWKDDPTGKTIGYAVWVLTGNLYMPEIGAILLTDDPSSPQSLSVVELPNIWDSKHNAYYNELIPIYDSLFSELNNLIAKCEYFKTSSGWG